MNRYTVRIVRWDTYEVRNVEATDEDAAEEAALDSPDQEHIDGGVDYVDVQPA